VSHEHGCLLNLKISVLKDIVNLVYCTPFMLGCIIYLFQLRFAWRLNVSYLIRLFDVVMEPFFRMIKFLILFSSTAYAKDHRKGKEYLCSQRNQMELLVKLVWDQGIKFCLVMGILSSKFLLLRFVKNICTLLLLYILKKLTHNASCTCTSCIWNYYWLLRVA